MDLTPYKRNNGILVVSLSGRLDTAAAPHAETQLDELIEAGEKRLIINCKELDYISSAGLRMLVAAVRRLQQINGKLVLSNMNERVYEVFNVAGFTAIFTIKPTESEALAEFT